MDEQGPIAADDPASPQWEEDLLEAVLRHQGEIDPHQVGQVLDLAAVGAVNNAWRNSPVEDWHAGGRLDDGDMLRINAHTTWRVRQIFRRWRADAGLAPGAHVDALDGLDSDATDWLAVRVWQWLVNPNRRLPTGPTLAEVAGEDLSEYADHADGVIGGFAATAEERGARYALWRSAAHGGLACRHWWGTPPWPALVGRFLHALGDPHDPHWDDGATSLDAQLRTAPPQIADRVHLERLLLSQPWNLDRDAAQWIARAGIRFLGPPLPPLPEHIGQPQPPRRTG